MSSFSNFILTCLKSFSYSFFIHFQPIVSFVIFLRKIHESMNRSILNFYSKKTVTHTVTAHLLYWIQSNMIISTIPKEYRLQLQL